MNGVVFVGACVSLDVQDPAGHRLIRFERLLAEQDPRLVTWRGTSVGRSTLFEVDENEYDAEWSWLYFGCKTCRDQGRPAWTRTHLDVVRLRLDELWRNSGDTPVTGKLVTDSFSASL